MRQTLGGSGRENCLVVGHNRSNTNPVSLPDTAVVQGAALTKSVPYSSVFTLCVVHVCVHMDCVPAHVCIHACVCTDVWRPEVKD